MNDVRRAARAAPILALLVWAGGCAVLGSSGTSGAPPAATASPSPTACSPDLGPEATERARQAAFAVRLAVGEGLSLVEAVQAVFDMPISAMTARDRADALRAVAALDLCPRDGAGVRDEIGPLVHRLAEQSGSDQPPAELSP